MSLESGEQLNARAVVVAVDGAAAARLLGDAISSKQGVTCLYFAALRPPVEQPILVLNGERRGPINNLCVPTLVAPSYGPGDASLVSATVLGITENSERLLAEVRQQLGDWFGPVARDWHHLRSYCIPYALPQQFPPMLDVPERPVRWQPGVYVCGDHRDNASIQGAMVSGRVGGERRARGPLSERVTPPSFTSISFCGHPVHAGRQLVCPGSLLPALNLDGTR